MPVEQASDTIDTLSLVTTITSASARKAKYGFSPLPSQTTDGTSAMRARRIASLSAPVRRDGVTSRPAPCCLARFASFSATSPMMTGVMRNSLLVPPISTAIRGCGRCS